MRAERVKEQQSQGLAGGTLVGKSARRSVVPDGVVHAFDTNAHALVCSYTGRLDAHEWPWRESSFLSLCPDCRASAPFVN